MTWSPGRQSPNKDVLFSLTNTEDVGDYEGNFITPCDAKKDSLSYHSL